MMKMPEQVSLNTLLAAIAVATALGVLVGGYAGREKGYADGVAKGSLAGFDMGTTSVLSGKIASDVRTLPSESGPLGNALCAGFRSGLPCKSLAEANDMIASSDPLVRIRGESCRGALTTLQGCGDTGPTPAAR